ncbi:MAG: cysteine desulfurase [Candidatus Nitricoxidivorans perseverans]|uniref:cysteine desulfurase n=1 Tax=Candidatus Nitricoxidivorans perseverans TaxID=2975601 RepID=A0AA49FND1_9PROT|nr:MAG: cysteine desulfurase [Candidatus Nitricoxidivorans perseverans]
MFAPVYLDHNATTPVHPAVLEAMLPFFSQRFGNPSSRHEYGRAARKAIDEARERVAHALGAHPTEVVFTGGGSEADNLFIKGAAACLPPGTIALPAIEHPGVREPARQLARQGWRRREIAVDAEGRVDAADFAAAMAERPSLVSVMLANNETGVIQDVAGLAEAARSSRAWFHTDAVQALGKLPVDFRGLNERGVHALSVSAHKLGGPKGVGALVVDKRVELAPLIAGGGHERGLRAGTENVPAIVGFGVACELAVSGLDGTAARLSRLRDALERGLADAGAAAVIFGAGAPRLPNTTCFALPGIDGETLVGKLDRAGFAIASGAACSSANPEPSHVLTAMGVEPGLARGAVRVSLGADNTPAQVEDFLLTLHATLSQLTSLTALETS